MPCKNSVKKLPFSFKMNGEGSLKQSCSVNRQHYFIFMNGNILTKDLVQYDKVKEGGDRILSEIHLDEHRQQVQLWSTKNALVSTTWCFVIHCREKLYGRN